jgi:LEA14-like dessication related protein
MEFLKSPSSITVLLTLLICTACGPSIIQGQPPFISIAGLSLEGQQLSADFNIHNPNGEPMEIDGIEIEVQVEEAVLTRYNSDFKLTVGANSTEEILVEQLPDDFTQQLLKSLQSGEVSSLPFRLEGKANTLLDGTLHFRNKGHLYPVPGRPGQFRSATTHSNRVHGEDPFRVIDDKQ